MSVNPSSSSTKELTAVQQALLGARVLVVDDNRINLTVTRKILDRHGVEVFLVNSGEEALRWLSEHKEQRLDAVLMDLHMPGIDGISCAQQVRDLPGREHQVIIALSATTLAEQEQKARQAGISGFIQKPVTAEGLVQNLGLLLQELRPRH